MKARTWIVVTVLLSLIVLSIGLELVDYRERKEVCAAAERLVRETTNDSPITSLTQIQPCVQGQGACLNKKFTVWVRVPDANTGKPSSPVQIWADKPGAVVPPPGSDKSQ